jgi:hypothetical protein
VQVDVAIGDLLCEAVRPTLGAENVGDCKKKDPIPKDEVKA